MTAKYNGTNEPTSVYVHRQNGHLGRRFNISIAFQKLYLFASQSIRNGIELVDSPVFSQQTDTLAVARPWEWV